MSKPLKGFITYSHEDTEQKNELRKRLAVMEQQDELVTWDDSQLTPGDKALQEDILREVADSDLLLYLVSAASLASENCKKELEEASKRNIRTCFKKQEMIAQCCGFVNPQRATSQGRGWVSQPIGLGFQAPTIGLTRFAEYGDNMPLNGGCPSGLRKNPSFEEKTRVQSKSLYPE